MNMTTTELAEERAEFAAEQVKAAEVRVSIFEALDALLVTLGLDPRSVTSLNIEGGFDATFTATLTEPESLGGVWSTATVVRNVRRG